LDGAFLTHCRLRRCRVGVGCSGLHPYLSETAGPYLYKITIV